MSSFLFCFYSSANHQEHAESDPGFADSVFKICIYSFFAAADNGEISRKYVAESGEGHARAAVLIDKTEIRGIMEYFQKTITVFGHTPTEFYGAEYAGKMVKTPTWIDIDTGAAFGKPPMLLRLDDEKPFYIEEYS